MRPMEIFLHSQSDLAMKRELRKLSGSLTRSDAALIIKVYAAIVVYEATRDR